MKNRGKIKYDEIPIPDALGAAVWDGIRRAEREKRRAAFRKGVAAAAAVFCVFFAGANIAPVYAYAADLPVLGAIVRVLHIGEGGARTDGAQLTADGGGETVKLRFENEEENMGMVPAYTAVHQLAPNRLVLTLHGVRGMDEKKVLSSLLKTEAVEDAYQSILGDDSAYEFVIVLGGGYTYEITEYANPPMLALRFFRREGDDTEKTVYYLRTKGMPYGEELALAAEQLGEESATQLKTADGEYILVVGQYATETEAAAALKSIEETHGGETGLFVASGTENALPQK